MLPLDLTARFSTHVSFGNWCTVSAMSCLVTGKDSAMAAALVMRMRRLVVDFIAAKVLERSKIIAAGASCIELLLGFAVAYVPAASVKYRDSQCKP